MENNIVLMQKNPETGLFEKELAIINAGEDGGLITSAYAAWEDGALYVHMQLTCGVDVSDSEFDYVYDAYGDGCEFDDVLQIIEEDDCYDPTWEMIFTYDEDRERLGEKIRRILNTHKSEIERILSERGHTQ